MSLSIQQRGRLINKSKSWPLAYLIVGTWFEDGDGVRSLLEKVGPHGMTASKSAIWDWLETRREYWAIAFARNAAILESAQNPDASSFAAIAFALLDKRDLKKIPVMETILDQTISAWLYDAEGYAEDPENADNLLDIDLIEPETPGELDHLLKESSLSASWVVGYVSSAYIAPNRPDINDMLTDLLNVIMTSGGVNFDRRLLDLIVGRLEQVSELIDESPDGHSEMLAKFDQTDARQWGAGFSAFRSADKRSWAPKHLANDDKAMLRTIETIANTGDIASEAKAIAIWVHARATN